MKKEQIHWVAGLVLVVVLGFGGYNYYRLSQKYAEADIKLASTTAQYQSKIKGLEFELAQLKGDNTTLIDSLQVEKDRNDEIYSKAEFIADTVGVLQKIQKTDEELLKKYSKVYFLNENYIPPKLANLSKSYLSDPKKPLLFHADALPFLEDVLSAAADDGVNLRVSSAFRSFESQASLKGAYLVTYGAGANKFSADQGYSEHQLGTTVDLVSSTSTALIVDFEKTAAYEWLTNNAYKYGFALSYPKGNAYYQYEPWHWRFVSVKLAGYLHDEGKNFYDLEQRKIDEYRAEFFD